MPGPHPAKLMTIALAMPILTSCAVTGDPNQGGIFWSEDAAKKRQQALIAQLQTEQQQLATLRADNAKLQSRLNTSLRDLRKRANAAANPKISSRLARLEAEKEGIARSQATSEVQLQQDRQKLTNLESEVQQLRRDIDDLAGI